MSLSIAEDEENYIWGVHINTGMEDTVVKMQVSYNNFVDGNEETLWLNPDGSSLEEKPDGTEVWTQL